MGAHAVRSIWLSGKPRSVYRHGPDVQYILFIQITILYVKAEGIKCRDSPVDVPILAITKILYAASSATFWWRTYRPRRISSLVRYSLIFRKTSRRSRLWLSTKTNKENPKARTDNRIEKTALTSRFSSQQKVPGADIILTDRNDDYPVGIVHHSMSN